VVDSGVARAIGARCNMEGLVRGFSKRLIELYIIVRTLNPVFEVIIGLASAKPLNPGP
jgi:hypothetical protein